MVKTTNSSDKFIIRLPDGMRDRIKKSADVHGRTMNAEVVQALNQMFPPEPSIEEVIGKTLEVIEKVSQSPHTPYREVLVENLSDLLDRISSGIEFDQDNIKTHHYSDGRFSTERFLRWKRVKKHGVEQSDLINEIKKGLLHHFGKSKTQAALMQLKNKSYDMAMRTLLLSDVKFKEPEKAYEVIEQDLSEFYKNNWSETETDYLLLNDNETDTKED